jgi:uncharacterized membrane protein YdbT with pleckstrin-like domain
VNDVCEEGEEKVYQNVYLWLIIVLPILLFLVVWILSALNMFCFQEEEEKDVEIGFSFEYDTEELDF